MPRFRYQAATLANERRQGLLEADTAQGALQELRRQGLIVLDLAAPSRLSSLWAALNQDVSLRPAIPLRELARLSQEWAGLIEAGITVEESLGLVIEGSRPTTRRVLERVRADVKGGAALHEALSRHPTCFPAQYRALIEAGEAAGALGVTLRGLADQLTGAQAQREEMRNALLYPAFLLVTATIGITVLLVVVVPNLETLFGDHGLDTLPLATQLVIRTSHALQDHGLTLAGSLVVLAVALLGASRTARGRGQLDRLILRLPVVGSLARGLATGRFMRTLSALIAGGVAVARAMPLAIRTVTNTAMRTRLAAAHEKIVTGTSLGDALSASGVFPADAIGLVRVGERTGRLDGALARAATLYETRSARALKALTAMLTPVLTIGFGLVAGLIIYAMLSTILSINDLAAR